MARPRKNGIEYFPFDVDFFSDKKIRILKSRFGADGITIYVYLLCETYKNGYYIQLDEDYEYIIADDLGMSNEKVKQVLKFLLERSLLDSTLFQSDTVITSHGIQRRFQEAVKSRGTKSGIEVEEKYWLLNEQETQPFIKCTLNHDNSKNNAGYSEKKPSYFEKNGIKKSKEKESRVKESKEKNNKAASPPVYYPNDEKLNQAFADFVDMRKQMKKPMTERAVSLAMNKLKELSATSSGSMDNDVAIKILEQSTMNCWQGLFQLKEEKQFKSSSNVYDEWRNA